MVLIFYEDNKSFESLKIKHSISWSDCPICHIRTTKILCHPTTHANVFFLYQGHVADLKLFWQIKYWFSSHSTWNAKQMRECMPTQMSDYINNLSLKQISSALVSHYQERHLTLSLIMCFEDQYVGIFYRSMPLTFIWDSIFRNTGIPKVSPALVLMCFFFKNQIISVNKRLCLEREVVMNETFWGNRYILNSNRSKIKWSLIRLWNSEFKK